MFNKKDIRREDCQLFGKQAKCGYDWWWHSLTAINEQTGEEKPFFFEFFLCNPSKAQDKPTFGQLGQTPSYLMVKAGCWGRDARQVHRFFSWKDIEVSYNTPFYVKASDCFLDDSHIKGSVKVTKEDVKNHSEYMCEEGVISWDLTIRKDVAFNVGYGASKIMRRLQLFEMFWHAQGMKSSFSGEIIYNGVKYLVIPERSYGYSDKNWGKDFTSPWVWLSSCDLVSEITNKRLEDSVFDIGGGCPKIGFIKLKRKLLSAFWHEGKAYEFNFSKFWTFTRTIFDCKETTHEIIWHVEQKTLFNCMVTDITCRKDDMLLINYEAPNGKKLHNRLWNGGNGSGTVSLFHKGKLVDRVIARHVGCEWGEYDSE